MPIRSLRLIVLVIHAAATVALAADPPHETPKPLAVGAAAPDFKLPGVDGKTYSLDDFDKSPVFVILFTCNHCPTAQAYEDRIKAIVADYTGKSVALVAINPNDPKSVRPDELGYTDLSDSFDEMKIRAKERSFNFPYLYDGETESVSRAYGPVTTPQAFVFDKDRKLRYVGRIDDNERAANAKTHELRDAIDALLAGKEPAVAQTRVFGCSVKWAMKQELVTAYLTKAANEPVDVKEVDAAGLTSLKKNDTGKVRLVNFWATWCAPCVAEMPALVEMNRMYRKRAFEFVTVSANFPDEKESVLAFLKKRQVSGTNLLFSNEDKYALMAAFDKDWDGALPYTLLIAPGGEVLYKKQGAIDPLELKRAIVKAVPDDRDEQIKKQQEQAK